MKTKFLIASALFFSLLFSCKEDKKEGENKSNETTEVVSNIFVVTLDLIAKKNDNMHLYYTEDNSINFSEEKSVWAEIKGSETSQIVIFKLQEDVFPTDLRLDLGYGKNIEQKEIVVNNIALNFLNKSFNIKSSEIANYFYPNKENTVLDAATGTLSRMKADQETAPSLYPHTSLEDELMKLTR
jgi:hypothetical protein